MWANFLLCPAVKGLPPISLLVLSRYLETAPWTATRRLKNPTAACRGFTSE